MNFQFDPTRPIYLQIVGEIKRRSLRGEYRRGSRLPSVRQLSKEMGVNPNTTARAYAELERQGFIFTKRGQGSFIVEDRSRIEKERKRYVDAAVARFVREVKALDLNEAQRKRILDRLKEDLNDRRDRRSVEALPRNLGASRDLAERRARTGSRRAG